MWSRWGSEPAAEAGEVGADADGAAGHERDGEALVEALGERRRDSRAARQALHSDAILVACTCMRILTRVAGAWNAHNLPRAA